MNRRDILKVAPATILAGYAAPAAALSKEEMIRHHHTELLRLLQEIRPEGFLPVSTGFFGKMGVQATAFSPGFNDGSDRRMATFKSQTGTWEHEIDRPQGRK